MSFECSSGFEQAREGFSEGVRHAESLPPKTVGVQGGKELATGFQGTGHSGMLGGVKGSEREVFELGFEAPDTEFAGEGDVHVLCGGEGEEGKGRWMRESYVCANAHPSFYHFRDKINEIIISQISKKKTRKNIVPMSHAQS